MSFPTLLCLHTLHTLHTQGRIYMHTQPLQIGEVAKQRGCQVPGTKGAVLRLGALLKGPSAVALEVNWHLSSYQLTPSFFGPIGTWTGDPSVPRPSPYRLSHCRPQRNMFTWFRGNTSWYIFRGDSSWITMTYKASVKIFEQTLLIELISDYENDRAHCIIIITDGHPLTPI